MNDDTTLAWQRVQGTVESEHSQLAASIAAIDEGKATSPVGAEERFNLVLGITCHAVYHAGQVQLIKRLRN